MSAHEHRHETHTFRYTIEMSWRPGNAESESRVQVMLAQMVGTLPERVRDEANSLLAKEIEAARRKPKRTRKP